jgi:hypothetical protein
MKKETLKKLIELEFDRCDSTPQLKTSVLHLIDIYESDNTEVESIPVQPWVSIPYDGGKTDLVPYYTICSCNPANGGSGVCGCVMANTMVPNRHISIQSSPSTNITARMLLNETE